MRFYKEEPFVWRYAALCVIATLCALEVQASEKEVLQDGLCFRSSIVGAASWKSPVSVGRIERVDDSGIIIEESSTGELIGFARNTIRCVLFSYRPDVDQASLYFLYLNSEGETGDRIWLRNGDSFLGKIQGVDRRRVYFRAFDRLIAIPRWRVWAIRLGDSN